MMMVVMGMGWVLMIDHRVMVVVACNHVVSFFCSFLCPFRLPLLALSIRNLSGVSRLIALLVSGESPLLLPPNICYG